jgi:hypothetical protein
VTPTSGWSANSRTPSSISLQTGTPRARAAATSGASPRHARALDEHVRPVQDGRVLDAEPNLGTLRRQLLDVEARVAVDRDHLHPAPPQRQRGGPARARETEHHGALHSLNWR